MLKKIDRFKKKLYLKRLEILFNKAVNEGKITEFDNYSELLNRYKGD